MTGSPLIAGWIAHLVFWVLLVPGIFYEEVRLKGAVAFVMLWVAGYFGLPRVLEGGGFFVAPYVGVLDVVLVLWVFKGDVRLT